MSDRSMPPVATSSRTASEARSSIDPSFGMTTRTGSVDFSPTTVSISWLVRRIVTKRRPSLPIDSKATLLRGPAETYGSAGESMYAGSMSTDRRSTRRRTARRAA